MLIEEYIAGREMGCGVMIAGAGIPVPDYGNRIEKEFFDYEAKYTAGFSDEITPADIAPEVKSRTEPHDAGSLPHVPLPRRGTRRLHCDAGGKPYFIELNSIPGMSPGASSPSR